MSAQKLDEVTDLVEELTTKYHDNTSEISEEIKVLILEKLKETKLKAGLKNKEIASRCKMTESGLSRLINKKPDSQVSTIINVAIGMRVQPKEFFDIDFDFDQLFKYLDDRQKEKEDSRRESST